ncbi:MAG TPA: hypothetical protein VGF75_00435 [Candidatus Saccharimonadales bacterium]|jgi:hypothetical protein
MTLQKTDGQIAKARKEWGNMANLESARAIPSAEQQRETDKIKDAISFPNLSLLTDDLLDFYIQRGVDEKMFRCSERDQAQAQSIRKIPDSPDTRHATMTPQIKSTTLEEVKGWLKNTPSFKEQGTIAGMIWHLAYAVVALGEEVRDKKF